MHLVRLDIDKKNSASQYQVGPLGGGLNAVYSPVAAASTLLNRFIKTVLFQGQSFAELEDSEFGAIDGSITWVDASGHLRMIACSGGVPIIPSRYVHSPLHPSDHPIYEDDVSRIRGVGNLFWEGDEEDGRWDDMRSDILAMVFCTPLGSSSPEKLWWAASRLGIHTTARTQPDEGYEHLKDEERQLLQRLRDAEAVDHDRTWWTIERERLQAELTHVARQQGLMEGSQPPAAWDDSQLRQQLVHAEEMIRRWDRRSQWHRRLAEVQSHLKTRSPYRRSADGSLIPTVEKFLKELTAGAIRQLPAWAVEASYLYNDSTDNFNEHSFSVADVDAAASRSPWMDRTVPAPSTRQRRLVDLAIRLAIATKASTRIGRIPMLLENSLEGFQGEPLEQLLHVLAGVSREGRQILITTQDEFIARRIAAHGGSVARVHENLRYAKPQYVIDSDTDLGLHPVLDRAPVVRYGAGTATGSSNDWEEVNKQLSGLSEQNQDDSWWQPAPAPKTTSAQPLVYQVGGKIYHLALDSGIEHAPGVGREAAERLRSTGIHRVSDLIQSDAKKVCAVANLKTGTYRRILSMIDMMCKTPQLRSFDAKVLVACGVTGAADLTRVRSRELAERIELFLNGENGQALLRRASEPERARLRSWLSAVRGDSHHSQSDFSSGTQKASRRLKRSRRVRTARRRDDHESTVVAATPRHFYLELNSPVVDAPTIGASMAEKLRVVNIVTVGDLVAAEASSIASALAEKSVSAQTVQDWQHQALLVCRIPNLRGQDAQLLVACGMATPELVAGSNEAILYEAIHHLAGTKQGLRILRGGNAPDRARVGQWIEWAQHCRGVRAA